MTRTVFFAALIASCGLAAPAAADASRTTTVDGRYGGSASASTSCALGAGCERGWSRTTPSGATASGSVSGYPAYRGVPRVGVGAPYVRPRHGVNLGGPVNRVGVR